MFSFPTAPMRPFQVADLAWLAGAWHGTKQSDRIDEYWSTLRAGTLMGMFRWLRQDALWFYEFMSIEAADDFVLLRIKHFNPGLVGWEEQHESKEFLLVDARERAALFLQQHVADPPWLVYDLQSQDRLVSYFTRPGSAALESEQFVYQRVADVREAGVLSEQSG